MHDFLWGWGGCGTPTYGSTDASATDQAVTAGERVGLADTVPMGRPVPPGFVIDAPCRRAYRPPTTRPRRRLGWRRTWPR